MLSSRFTIAFTWKTSIKLLRLIIVELCAYAIMIAWADQEKWSNQRHFLCPSSLPSNLKTGFFKWRFQLKKCAHWSRKLVHCPVSSHRKSAVFSQNFRFFSTKFDTSSNWLKVWSFGLHRTSSVTYLVIFIRLHLFELVMFGMKSSTRLWITFRKKRQKVHVQDRKTTGHAPIHGILRF